MAKYLTQKKKVNWADQAGKPLQTFKEVPKLTKKEREEMRTRRQEAFNEKMTKKQEKEAKMKRGYMRPTANQWLAVSAPQANGKRKAPE